MSTKIITAKEVLDRRMSGAKLMEFFITRYMEFTLQHPVTHEEELDKIRKDFHDFMEVHTNNTDPSTYEASVLLNTAITFIASHPLFSVNEFVKAGVRLTEKEKTEFLTEFALMGRDAAKREALLPYTAIIGEYIVRAAMRDNPDMQEQIDKMKAVIDRYLGARLLLVSASELEAPTGKALAMLEDLEKNGIELDSEGYIIKDTENLLPNDGKQRKESSGTTSTEGIPTTPESLN